MKSTHTKAFYELQALGCPVFVHPSAPEYFDISAEQTNSSEWVDYYEGAFREGWIFGTHPTLDEVLWKHGLLAEWVNPAHLRVYEA